MPDQQMINHLAVDHTWVVHFIALLLSAITVMLAIIAWFARQSWNEQKEVNKDFRLTCERIWSVMGSKVSIDLCTVKSGANKCQIEDLEHNFRKHSHTSLPDDSKLILKE